MMKNIFAQILNQKREAVSQLRAYRSLQDFRERALEIRKNGRRHRLLQALESDLQRLNIIAEFKRRSPSLGIIRDDLSADEVVRCYERGGACAISVLTDEEFFGGSIADLGVARSSTNLPLLRKDFIIDPIQIYEAAITGADAVLLIVAALDKISLKDLRALAEDELGLDALVEVHNSEELHRALDANAKIIGVNNRDLRTFRVSLDTSERLIAETLRDRVMISESGLQSAKDLRHLQALGFRGFLIGEALMRASDPEEAVRNLITGAEDQSLPKIGCSHRPVAGLGEITTAHSAVATAYGHNPIQIKICGVTNANDARVCAQLGANMIGFNFFPKSPRYVDPNCVRRIIETMPHEIGAVGVFVGGTAQEIRNTASLAGVRCVQLHGDISPAIARQLAAEFRVIRAFSTHATFQPEDVSLFPNCDVLIDAHHPDLRGGTGQTCDWSSARATLRFTRFLILSGGLSAKNVSEAIAAVAPHAIDVCSGVESAPGIKDHSALKDFMCAVRIAEQSLHDITM